IALQAPINSMLGKATGSFQAAFISFAIGTVVLAVIAAFARGGFGTMGAATSLQWYYLTGGVLGAVYVTTVLVTVRELGAGPVVAATIAGQLAASVVLDQFGLLGLPKAPITVGKVIGVVLLALGVYLVVRD
ncbi:MAG TPA: DMT family transporter, partial [Solirubrobacteraceae bacterium]|nr:DMT family transporter [Solirubrobacteraceae bacterium]